MVQDFFHQLYEIHNEHLRMFPSRKACQALHGVPHSHCWLFGIATLFAMLPTFNCKNSARNASCEFLQHFLVKVCLRDHSLKRFTSSELSLSIYPTCNVLLMFVGSRIISHYHEREDCYPPIWFWCFLLNFLRNISFILQSSIYLCGRWTCEKFSRFQGWHGEWQIFETRSSKAKHHWKLHPRRLT